MQTSRRRLLQSALAVGGVHVAPSARGAETKRPVRLLVPAYFRPSGAGLADWERLLKAARVVRTIAIVNLANGPGDSADASYRSLVERAGKAKLSLIGYVHTGYGKRPRSEIEVDVRNWAKFYSGLNGIFYDLQPSDAAHVEHYADLRRLAKRHFRNGIVVTNPGTICAEEYFSRKATDCACIFENLEGFEGFRLPEWARDYNSKRFAALPYNVEGIERMQAAIRHMRNIGVGTIYVTDRGGANPWNGLPSYWDETVKAAVGEP